MAFRYNASVGRSINFDITGLAFYVSVQNRIITIGYNTDMSICFISEYEKGGVIIKPNESIKLVSTYYYLLLVFVLSNIWENLYEDNDALKARFNK